MTIVTLKSRCPDELQLEPRFGKGGRPREGHSACEGQAATGSGGGGRTKPAWGMMSWGGQVCAGPDEPG